MSVAPTSCTRLVLGRYGAAGAVADEVLNAIRTVTAFNSQKLEVARCKWPTPLVARSARCRGALVPLGTQRVGQRRHSVEPHSVALRLRALSAEPE